MNDRERKSFNFQGLDLRSKITSSPGLSKRFSSDFSTPSPKRSKNVHGTPEEQSFPKHLCQMSSQLFNSPSAPSTPRLVFKTKDCPECSICSNELFEVRHPHFSSQNIELKNSSKNGRPYFCTTCRRKHSSPSHGKDRLKVMMGSSTLHNIWQSRSFSPTSHIDFDCIVGGRIHDIHAAFIYQYNLLPNPMDVVLACGVNNIPTEDSAEDIITQFKSLVKTIKLHSETEDHKFPNRVVICSILFAPKYASSRLGRNDMTEKVRRVNEWIRKFNQEETGDNLDLHTYGVQGDPNQDPLVHRLDEWKENEPSRKLHLQPFVKDKIAVDLIRLFDRLDKKRK